MKNVIFMMNVDCKGEGRYATERTHGYQYCEKSWREWADKHGFEVLVMHDPIHDNDKMSIGWRRYYIHDIFLDKKMIIYRMYKGLDLLYMRYL